MISVFLREQKHYTRAELAQALDCSEEKTARILHRLREYGVIKAVKAADLQRDLTDLTEEGIETVAAVSSGDGVCYVLTFVGVVVVENRVLKCYPKYLPDGAEPRAELKQVLKVLEKYHSREQAVRLFNGMEDSGTFPLLSAMLFLLQDYFEYGLYSKTQETIETNGPGEILWERTISANFPLLSQGRPYYPELFTRKRVNDDSDFFRRLHACVLTRCTKELRDADLLDLFDIAGADLSDEKIEDFGELETVLEHIYKEMNIQFNTRRQLLLKTLYAFLEGCGTLEGPDSFSLYGTDNFPMIWETVCAEVLGSQLYQPVGGLPLPVPLVGEYAGMRYRKLIDLIGLTARPRWSGWLPDGSAFTKEADGTLIPDIILVAEVDGECQFLIFDAKYYVLQLEPDKKLRGQPGIESVTKQYLYQLAYQPFLEAHGIYTVRNCFLLPTAESEIIDKGVVSLPMLRALGLADIQLRLLPAREMYQHYLADTKLDVRRLNL